MGNIFYICHDIIEFNCCYSESVYTFFCSFYQDINKFNNLELRKGSTKKK